MRPASRKRELLQVSSLALAATIALTSNPAQAQSEAPNEIIVTAQKRPERLQDVPTSVSVLTSDKMISDNLTRLDNYISTVPGVSIQSPGNGQAVLSIRGISTGDASNPSVGIVIDDVPFGSSALLGYGMRTLPDIDPANLSQIEVLRGPQGTLYGASSIGGLVKFVTKAPSVDMLSGRVEASTSVVTDGNVGYGLRGAINIPVNSDFAIRINGYRRRDPGYVDNISTGKDDVNSQDYSGGLISALYKPDNQFSIRLTALLQDQKAKGASSSDADYQGNQILGDLVQSDIAGTGTSKINSKMVWGDVGYDFGNVELTSITAYGRTVYRGKLDINEAYGSYATTFFGEDYTRSRLENDFVTKKFSQELRLSAEASTFISLTVGGFYTHEDTSGAQALPAVNANTGESAGLLYLDTFPLKYEEIAGFGNVNLKFSPKFEIQLGGRYAHLSQRFVDTQSGALFGDSSVISDPIHTRANAFTYLATALYRFNPDLTAYVRMASGYRASGPNPSAASFGYPESYDPDKTRNYELGIKGSLLGGLADFDLSAYYIDWKDLQITLRDPATGFAFFDNASAAVSKGLEMSLTAHPTQGLSIAASASINDAKLSEDLPADLADAKDGDRLPYSSPFSATISVDQSFILNDNISGNIGLTFNHVGKRPGNFAVSEDALRLSLPSYQSLDVRTSFSYEDWTLSLFAQNVTNERGVIGISRREITGLQTASSLYSVNFIRPRQFGASIAKKF